MDKPAFPDNREALTFDDVTLYPQISEVNSRLDTDLTFYSKKLKLKYPVFGSPMDTVTDAVMAGELAAIGCIGIIHRFMELNERFRSNNESGSSLVGIAVGLDDSLDDIQRNIEQYQIDNLVLCLDVANGGHKRIFARTAELAKILKGYYGYSLMAGNVATKETAIGLIGSGADLIRVGIGSGSICSTRMVTGHGLPMLTSISEVRKACDDHGPDVKVICDGGIRYGADIAKALAFGAAGVMLGSLLAGTTEAPGKVSAGPDGQLMKSYRGMASMGANADWKPLKAGTAPEGISVRIPFKGPVRLIVEELMGGLRSALTYADASNLEEFYQNTTYVRVTSAGIVEAQTHIDRVKVQ